MLYESGRVLLLSGILALGLATPVAAQEEAAPKPEAPSAEAPARPPLEPMNTWYAQVLAHSPVGINVTHFWSKEENLRAETVIAGRRIVTIVTEDTYYAYDLLVRTGVAVQRSAIAVKQDADRVRPFGNEYFALLRQGAELIGSDQLGGGEVDIYQITDDRGRRKVWVTQDERRLPLRVFAFQRGGGREFTTDYLNWQRGLPILDSFFTPEPGINFAILTHNEYVTKQANREPIGPVPVLYSDLLHGF